MALALAGFFGRCALTLASGARTLFGLPAGRMLAAARRGRPRRNRRRGGPPALPRRLPQSGDVPAGHAAAALGRPSWARSRSRRRSCRIGAARGLLLITARARRRRRRLSRLRRLAQHGRLAQLEPERAQRPAAAGAAEFPRTCRHRPRRARAHGGATMSDRYPGYDVLAKREHAVVERPDPPRDRRADGDRPEPARLLQRRRMGDAASDLRADRAAAARAGRIPPRSPR